MAVRIGFVRDLISGGIISVERCPTTSMLADPMTKALGPIDFQRKLKGVVGRAQTTQYDKGADSHSAALSRGRVLEVATSG